MDELHQTTIQAFAQMSLMVGRKMGGWQAFVVFGTFMATAFAGCVNAPSTATPGPGGNSNPTSTPADSAFQGAATSVSQLGSGLTATGAPFTITGFADFGVYFPAIAELFPSVAYGNLTTALLGKLKSTFSTDYSLGFLMDQNALAALGKPDRPRFQFIKDYGAVLAFPGPSTIHQTSYVRVQGEGYDLLSFLDQGKQDGGRALPLLVARTMNTLTPFQTTLENLCQNFSNIMGSNLVVSVQTRGIAFGTTLSALGAGGNAVDVGLYELVAAYATSTEQITTARVGAAKLWMGTGQEYLGRDVAVAGFLVSESGLLGEANSRSNGLAGEAVLALNAARSAYSLTNPWDGAGQSCRVPGFLFLYQILPSTYSSVSDLSAFATGPPGDSHEATVPISLGSGQVIAGRLAGGSLKKLCGPECASLPYDLGVYDLASFNSTTDSFGVHQLPVLLAVRGFAPEYTGQRVSIEGMYAKSNFFRNAFLEKARLKFPSPGWGKALLEALRDSTQWEQVVHNVPGFLWANKIETVAAMGYSLPILLFPPCGSDITSNTVRLSWWWPSRGETEDYRYSVHQAATRPGTLRPTTGQDTGSPADSAVVNLNWDTRYVRIQVSAPQLSPSTSLSNAVSISPRTCPQATTPSNSPAPSSGPSSSSPSATSAAPSSGTVSSSSPSPTTSSASSPLTVTAAISNSNPCPSTNVIVSVHATDLGGSSVGSASVSTTWHYYSGPTTRTGTTDSSGNVQFTGYTGDTPRYQVTVDVSVTKGSSVEPPGSTERRLKNVLSPNHGRHCLEFICGVARQRPAGRSRVDLFRRSMPSF
jgi:hypothetical protein